MSQLVDSKSPKNGIEFEHEVIKWEDSWIPMNMIKSTGNNQKQRFAINS